MFPRWVLVYSLAAIARVWSPTSARIPRRFEYPDLSGRSITGEIRLDAEIHRFRIAIGGRPTVGQEMSSSEVAPASAAHCRVTCAGFELATSDSELVAAGVPRERPSYS